MSPFSEQLRLHRIRCGFRQKELAKLLGYEQSYVSALEIGLKGPPTNEFVKKLIAVLKLSQEDQETLNVAIAASQRKINIPSEAPTEIYWLFHKLRQKMDQLHPVQIALIETALSLPLNASLQSSSTLTRIKRRYQNIYETEAEM